MSDNERGSAVFKPRARLLSLLGEQLITSEVIAVVELVKNAYDADATLVSVRFEKASDPEEGMITVEDNGFGMTLDTILNVWLEPGTEFRKAQRERGEKSPIHGRPLLGEKGIGRFAAHRLGNVIEVITKTKDSEMEIELEVNWRLFDQSKYLSDIPVNWMTRKPKVLVKEGHGTRIVIRDLKNAWSSQMVTNLREKLDALQAPLKEKFGFQIKFIAPEYPEVQEKKMTLKEIIDKALYSFTGYVDEKGFLDAVYQFKHEAFLGESRKMEIKEDLRDETFALPGGNLRVPNCGPFTVRFYAWDLDPATLKETITRGFYEKVVKPHTGVQIYRDGFRVWPYGELGNDWLNLDHRRFTNPTKCVSNNQVIGLVDISSSTNPELVDKTDREGIIENEAYNFLKCLAVLAINVFEIERRRDRDRILSLMGKEKRIDRTRERIEELRIKINKNNDLAKYEKEVDNIENAYMTEVRETVEPLIVSAGIGIAYLMPAHEIQFCIIDLEKLIHELDSDLTRLGVGGRVGEKIPNMLQITDMIKDIADGALELARKKPETFSLRSAVDFACYIKRPDLNSEKVRWTVTEKEEIMIKGQKNLVMSCILNLLENSIYWLSTKKEKQIQITIDRDSGSKPRITVSDNGPGIRKDDLPYLGEAYWTRKPNGTGLGLFISKRAMKAFDGQVDFGLYGEEPQFLPGANVMLRFSSDFEAKS